MLRQSKQKDKPGCAGLEKIGFPKPLWPAAWHTAQQQPSALVCSPGLWNSPWARLCPKLQLSHLTKLCKEIRPSSKEILLAAQRVSLALQRSYASEVTHRRSLCWYLFSTKGTWMWWCFLPHPDEPVPGHHQPLLGITSFQLAPAQWAVPGPTRV